MRGVGWGGEGGGGGGRGGDRVVPYLHPLCIPVQSEVQRGSHQWPAQRSTGDGIT